MFLVPCVSPLDAHAARSCGNRTVQKLREMLANPHPVPPLWDNQCYYRVGKDQEPSQNDEYYHDVRGSERRDVFLLSGSVVWVLLERLHRKAVLL